WREVCETVGGNGGRFGFHAAGSPAGWALLEQAGALSAALPVVIVFNGQILENPTNSRVAEALGVDTHPKAVLYDIAVIGAGPAGPSAAVHGGSEGVAPPAGEAGGVGGPGRGRFDNPKRP